MRTLFILFSGLLLGACTLTNPSFLQQEKMAVASEPVVYERHANQVTRADILGLADQIRRSSESDVTVTVVYPLVPNASANQKIATAQANQITTLLRDQGVAVPVHTDLQATGKTTPNLIRVSFTALKARANCNGTIEDADASHYTHAADNPYALGCSRDQMISAMIARPSDLLGNDTTSATESQRLSKSLEAYRAGERATEKADEGLSASDVYSQ